MAITETPAPRLGIPEAPPVATREPSPWRRRALWVAAIVAVLAIGMAIGGGFPERLVIGIGSLFDGIDSWVIENQRTHWLFTGVLNPIKDAIKGAVDGLTTVFERMTWLGLLAAATAFAGLVAGWRMALLAAVGVASFGLLDVWERSLQTLALVTISVLVTLAIGVPLGIWAGRRPSVERILRPILDAMQTVPAYSYLLPFVLFLGTGYPPAVAATVVFALPPAVRLTALGIRSVSGTTLEVADAFGTTSRQTLRKVQIPIAKPSIMLGVNQTIMMALGMVVIAAIVGAEGLGREVLDALKLLNVGDALNAGIAIVMMAIVLDRVTTTWSQRERTHRGKALRIAGRAVSRRLLIGGAVAATVAGVVVGREVLRQQEWPEGLTFSVAGPTDDLVEWSQRNLGGLARAIGDNLTDYLLDPFQSLLTGQPWWIVAGLAALAGYKVKGVRLAVFAFVAVFLLGAIGMWELSMETLSLVLVAVAITLVFAIPIGILASRSDGVDRVIRPILDAMQTMPAFVYLVPVLLLFSIGTPIPAVIASVVYALPVGIRLTNLGIRQVPSTIVEAADAYGATRAQRLRKVELPLARPSILLGVNQTIMMVLSVVIIGGMIGAGGLGFEALVALSKKRIGQGVIVGLSILLIAIVLDRITQAMGAAPRSQRGPVGLGGMSRWPRIRTIVAGGATNEPAEGDRADRS
ncbi:MAG TPA: ABC transporter permease subunit [Actinomycetota bacterium]|nr:ABC transporter permease subunit [Actinomycetota bacterium]